ncbi:hypothetical protein [Helicobacter sp. T3_23-1056]
MDFLPLRAMIPSLRESAKRSEADSWQSIKKQKNIVILRFRKKPKYLKTPKSKQRYFTNAQYDKEISVIASE